MADLKELKSIILVNKVWDVRPLSEGRKPLTPKWVRMAKKDDTKKSRLVVRGFNMIHGVDYEETFSPVAKMVAFRIFLTFAAVYSLHTCALDVKTAFLNAEMEREVWMKPPDDL